MSPRWLFPGLLGTVCVLSAAPAAAAAPPLRWGGDKSGGGPYIIEAANGQMSGFEVELANYLAARLGRQPQFVQGEWDKLLDLLGRKDIDIILNGYEWLPEREGEFSSTIPYYIYKLQLLAPVGDPAIQSWDDLPGKRVGVLENSAAQRYLLQRFDNAVHLKPNPDVTNVLGLVERRQDLDATVQDLPAVIYYAPDFPKLRRVGEPIPPGNPGYYVIYVRAEDAELREQLNQALRDGIRDGTLRRIYEKYRLWNADQEHLAELAAGPWPPSEELAPSVPYGEKLLANGKTLLQAAVVTVALSFLSMPLAIVLGVLIAVGRLYGPGLLGRALTAYVEFLRGTPLLLQLYVLYYMLPQLGVTLPALVAAVLGLAINYSAYEAENYRAGLLAVPQGQMEAALALGMSKWTALRRVIIPQAVRIVIPPVTNDFIALFKDTSVCSVIAVTELTGRFNQLYNNNHRMVLELALMTALLYLLMSYPLALVARRLERRFPKVMV